MRSRWRARVGPSRATTLGVLVTLALTATATWAGLAAAPAGAAAGGPTTCNFCVLSSSASNALQVGGTSILTVTGNLVVDSNKNPAASVSSKSIVSVSGAIGVVGVWSTTPDSTTSPTPLTSAGAPDCLASAVTPTPSGIQKGALNPTSGTVTATPGNYTTLGSSGGTVNLDPGLYTVTGSFTNTNGGTINGSGVELYFPGSATFHLSNNSHTTVNAGSPSSVLVFYDRTNTQAIQIDKGATADLTGDLYAKAGKLQGAAGTINGTCISVDTANISNGASVTQLPEGGAYGLVIFIGLFGGALLALCLLSTPRRVAKRALARARGDRRPQPDRPAPRPTTPVGS